MNIDDIEVITGGKFDINEIIKSHTTNTNGQKVLNVTPELYEVLKNEWSIETTKQLSEAEIKKVCNYYKGKYIVIPEIEDDTIEDGDDDYLYYMDIAKVVLDDESYEFCIYSNMVYIIDSEQRVYPSFQERDVDSGCIITKLPVIYNDTFIHHNCEYNLLADKYDFLQIARLANFRLSYLLHVGEKVSNRLTNIINKEEVKKSIASNSKRNSKQNTRKNTRKKKSGSS